MPKISPTKEERKEAADAGYELGVYYRQKFFTWLRKMSGGK